jgi:hypothetical protein
MGSFLGLVAIVAIEVAEADFEVKHSCRYNLKTADNLEVLMEYFGLVLILMAAIATKCWLKEL